MKITFFMEDYYLGGLDTFVINLINNWPVDEDEITLICNRKHSGLGLLEKAITRPHRLIKHNMVIFTSFFELKQAKNRLDQISTFILRLFSPILRYIFLAYNIFALRKILSPKEADRLMVINGGYPGGDSCRAASIAWGIFSRKALSIHNIHGIILKPGRHIFFQEYLVDSLVAHFTGDFVMVSQAVVETASFRNGIAKNNRFRRIYNGVEITDTSPIAKPEVNIKMELGIPLESRLCLMLGGYHCHKNFDKGHSFLFRAFGKVIKDIPAAHLLVCGYGSKEDIIRIRSLVLKLNLNENIHLSGFRNDIPSVLKCADLLLISSQAFESFCLAGIEAMAHSVPVVATDVGAIPEVLINGKGGYCVKRDDVDSFAGHIVKLLSDDRLRKEQGENGFQRYQGYFTASRMAEEYSNLIHYG